MTVRAKLLNAGLGSPACTAGRGWAALGKNTVTRLDMKSANGWNDEGIGEVVREVGQRAVGGADILEDGDHGEKERCQI